MKPAKKTLQDFLKDERKAVKEYKRYGFTSLAKDEAKHARFILRRLGK